MGVVCDEYNHYQVYMSFLRFYAYIAVSSPLSVRHGAIEMTAIGSSSMENLSELYPLNGDRLHLFSEWRYMDHLLQCSMPH